MPTSISIHGPRTVHCEPLVRSDEKGLAARGAPALDMGTTAVVRSVCLAARIHSASARIAAGRRQLPPLLQRRLGRYYSHYLSDGMDYVAEQSLLVQLSPPALRRQLRLGTLPLFLLLLEHQKCISFLPCSIKLLAPNYIRSLWRRLALP